MKKLITLSLVAIMSISLASCGGGESDTEATLPKIPHSNVSETTTVKVQSGHEEIVGTWVAESITADGVALDVDEELPPEQCYIRIHGNGTGDLSSKTMLSTMRYTFDGTNLVVTALNQSRNYSYSNGKITYNYTSDSGEQMEIIYVKQDITATTTTQSQTSAAE